MKLLRILFKMPAAKRISGAQLAPMVKAAAAKGDTCSLQLLAAEAPDFHQLQPAAALRAAVEGGSMPALSVLLGSRAVAAADDVRVPALVLAIHNDEKGMWRDTVAKMLNALLGKLFGGAATSVPMADEAARFSADGWSQVLAEAVSSNRPDLFSRLWQHPAVASLKSQHLGQLLRCTSEAAAAAAASAIEWKAVHSLLQQHPAWGSMSEADMLAYRPQQAVQKARPAAMPVAARSSSKKDSAAAMPVAARTRSRTGAHTRARTRAGK
uniref:Uncharacterized protein n=1 Tax=Tetradesmus obliquus TaxID=3088 RepID=A0A383VDK3_TETOB|eukprot:jgi/Sobl393_1/15305/SZX63033.1